MARISVASILLFLLLSHVCSSFAEPDFPINLWIPPPDSYLFAKPLNAPANPTGWRPVLRTKSLLGFVDLHTHPLSHLGFGGRMLHGAPDIGLTMPAYSIFKWDTESILDPDCNTTHTTAQSTEDALGTCRASHLGIDLISNSCGTTPITGAVYSQLIDFAHAYNSHTTTYPHGAPLFPEWPRHDDFLHQQMWHEWIKRAYDGGMRVMVALAVNSKTLAHAVGGTFNPADKESGDVQIEQIIALVNRHPWMEVAYSSRDIRRIVGEQDKLAVIVGVELDDIGNFMSHNRTSILRLWGLEFLKFGISPSEGSVRREIQRLYAKGVRYIFPVHVVDNFFGGTAVYENFFQIANQFQFGSWWDLACAATLPAIGHKVEGIGFAEGIGLDLLGIGAPPAGPNCGDHGHVNTRSLQTRLGGAALDEMMRLGMIIDIDHASHATVEAIIKHTDKRGSYPIVSGHNRLRVMSDHENSRTFSQYQLIAKRSGIAGIGWGSKPGGYSADAVDWIASVRSIESTGVQIALGSDINGLVKQPAPRAVCGNVGNPSCVEYSDSFPQARWGSNRTWDYNTDGVAHIGLFPDFLRDVEQLGAKDIVDKLFKGAEAFAKMWERAESLRITIPASPEGMKINMAEYGSNCGLTPAQRYITSWVDEQCYGRTDCRYKFTWAPWVVDPKADLCVKNFTVNWTCPGEVRRTRSIFHVQTPQQIRFACLTDGVGMRVQLAITGCNINPLSPGSGNYASFTNALSHECDGTMNCAYPLNLSPWGTFPNTGCVINDDIYFAWTCPNGVRNERMVSGLTSTVLPLSCN